MSARFPVLLLLPALLVPSGCERRPAAPEQAQTTGNDTPPEPDPVERVEPRQPTYEDAPGTVAVRHGEWVIDVPGEKAICLPFEAPADARKDGQKVRFTLYLSGEAPARCRVVETFVSMRLAD